MTQSQAFTIAAALPYVDAIRFLRSHGLTFRTARTMKRELDAHAPWLYWTTRHPLTNAERRLAGLPPDSYRTNYPRQSIAATKNTTQPPHHQPFTQQRPTAHPVGLAFSSTSTNGTTPPNLPARPRPRQSPPKTPPRSLPTG